MLTYVRALAATRTLRHSLTSTACSRQWVTRSGTHLTPYVQAGRLTRQTPHNNKIVGFHCRRRDELDRRRHRQVQPVAHSHVQLRVRRRDDRRVSRYSVRADRALFDRSGQRVPQFRRKQARRRAVDQRKCPVLLLDWHQRHW